MFQNSSYAKIMRDLTQYEEAGGSNRPRILGLSASIVTGKVNDLKFRQQLIELERTMHSKVITADNLANYLQ